MTYKRKPDPPIEKYQTNNKGQNKKKSTLINKLAFFP